MENANFIIEENDKLDMYFHVGIHKTGSTAIQTLLFENKDNLMKEGYYLPVDLFTFENKSETLRIALRDDEAAAEDLLIDIVKKARNKECHSVIISDEDYAKIGEFNKGQLQLLNKYFNVKTIIYIRRQDLHIESAYGFCVTWQSIRETRTIQEFSFLNDYSYIIGFYEELFGQENIIVKNYDAEVKSGNLLVGFIKALEIENNIIDYNIEGSKNVTPNKYIIQFFNEINYTPLNKKIFYKIYNYLVQESIIKNGPKGIFFTKDERKEIMEKCKEGNELIAKRYFNSDLLFSDDYNIEEQSNLSENVIDELIEEVYDKFNIKLLKANDVKAINQFKNRLGLNDKGNGEVFREFGLYYEQLGDYESAYYFMKMARVYRPNGEFIIEKCEFYEEILKKLTSEKTS